VALRWNLEAVKDSDNVCWIESPCDIPGDFVKEGDVIMNPVTNTLIWSTIAVDLPGITEANAAEFFARLQIWERIFGAFMIRAEVDGKRPEGEAAFITRDEVIAHIGMTANVSPVSRAKWLKRIDREMSDIVTRFERQREALTAA
jgi:hypothetical protein